MIFKHWLFLVFMGISNIIFMLLFIPILIILKLIDYYMGEDNTCVQYWYDYTDWYINLLRKIKDVL